MTFTSGKLYQTFKYSIYALLIFTVSFFFVEDFSSMSVTYKDGLELGDIIVAFTGSIDTFSWLILLLLLELETYIIPDDAIHGWVDWSLTSLTFLCGGVILYAFYGYVETLYIPNGFSPQAGGAVCDLVGSGATFASSLDEYVPLDLKNCLLLANGAMYNEALNMFSTPGGFSLLSQLVWLDVVNAGIWIIVVIILELEVFLESSKLVGTRFFYIYKSFKLVLYGILVINIFYWWYLNEPVDALDAFLWLAAFFFIEMNMLNWQEEVASSRAEAQKVGPAIQA
tara:strand:+ start:597 stop:1445 length:849 start_codon:yes stop_codon:yes gene_type:complete